MAWSAPRNFIGCAVAAAFRRPDILATFCAERAVSSSRHGAGAVIRPGLLRSTRASITEPTSPTSGAAMGWLLSISVAAMST